MVCFDAGDFDGQMLESPRWAVIVWDNFGFVHITSVNTLRSVGKFGSGSTVIAASDFRPGHS